MTSGRAAYCDMNKVAKRTWPHWGALNVNTVEFHDPVGGRHVRIVLFEHLHPGQRTQLAPSFIPAHRNSYDVLSATLRWPASAADGDPTTSFEGELVLRPETLFTTAITGTGVAPVIDHEAVNVYVHTEGASGEPMITLDQAADAVSRLHGQAPDRLRIDRGEFVEDDGTVRELLEVCWETLMGRPYKYPAPAVLTAPVVYRVGATPSTGADSRPEISEQRFAPVDGTGVSMRLVRVDTGAELPETVLDTARLVAVLRGAVELDGTRLDSCAAIFGGLGQTLGRLVAQAPTLLWVVDWLSRGPFVDEDPTQL